MDYDNDFEISLKDFQYSIQKILQLRISDDELLLYWRKIPIALENMSYDEFVQRFHKYIDPDRGQYKDDLNYINTRILEHTTADLEDRIQEKYGTDRIRGGTMNESLRSMDSEVFRKKRRYNVDMKLVNKINK